MSAVSTHKVTLATLMDFGLFSELNQTNRTLRNPALDTVPINSPHQIQDLSQVSLSCD